MKGVTKAIELLIKLHSTGSGKDYSGEDNQALIIPEIRRYRVAPAGGVKKCS